MQKCTPAAFFIRFYLSYFLFEHVMAPAAGYADFAAALGSAKTLFAAWTFEVGKVLPVTLQVSADFIANESDIPVVFVLTFGQIFREGTVVGIDDNQESQCAEEIAGHENIDENQYHSQKG